MFFVTLKTKGGHFDLPPPAYSEINEARTMKLCTVIAYYITSITKQLKFLNSIVLLLVAIVLLCA